MIDINSAGGKQSKLETACHLLPAAAVLKICATLKSGADAYEPPGINDSLDANWRRIPRRDHINHAMTHILMHLSGDASENHLEHAACRLLFAIETD